MENNNMENQVKPDALDKKNKFLDFVSKNIVKISIIICAAAAVIGPIIFCIITSFKRTVESNGTIKYRLVYEKEYIISVCVIALIILGIFFILSVATYVYNFIKKKEENKI